jgi:hypothetical protein
VLNFFGEELNPDSICATPSTLHFICFAASGFDNILLRIGALAFEDVNTNDDFNVE